MIKSARGQACLRCKRQDGTIVNAHYSGQLKAQLGHGVGQKVHDLATAWLCQTCHAYFDQEKGITANKRTEKELWDLQKAWVSEEMLLLCLKTAAERFKQANKGNDFKLK